MARPLRAVAVFLALTLAAAPALADYVFMHDGYTLHGKLRKEGQLIADVGQDIWAPKVGWVMDDGVRRVFFHHRVVAESQEDPKDAKSEFETFKLNQPWNPFKGAFRNISPEGATP